MDSFSSMLQKLEPLGLYSLEDNDGVCCELKAYAEGLDALFDMIDELEREFYIPTAQSYGLSLRERFFGKERSDLTAEQRREELIRREQSVKRDITEDSFDQFLRDIGLESFTVTANHSRADITVDISDQKTDGEKSLIEKQIAAEVPAYMTLTINYAE